MQPVYELSKKIGAYLNKPVGKDVFEKNDLIQAKDLSTEQKEEMAKQADYGFMIWNRKSKGTHNNMINLATFNKKILLYMTSDKQFYVLNALQEVEDMKNGMNKQQHNEISDKESIINKQLSLFY